MSLKIGCSTAAAATAAVAAGFLTSDPAVNYGAGTSYSGVDTQCGSWTVADTGTAFHAEIEINDPGLLVLDYKNCVRAYGCAESTADTLFDFEFEGGDIAQISMLCHFFLLPKRPTRSTE